MSQSTPDLKGYRVAVLAADGFELLELVIPVQALRSAGATVEVLSIRKGHIRGMNLHEPSRRVAVTKPVAEANPSDFHALLIPGGFISPDLLRQSEAARNFVRAVDSAKKPIATLCHGLWLLASAGLTEGRTLTSWPGIRDDLVNSGATWLDQELVRDGNWVSSRGPQDLKAFVRGMLDLFSGTSTQSAHPLRNESSPQRDQPPQLALATLKWAAWAANALGGRRGPVRFMGLAKIAFLMIGGAVWASAATALHLAARGHAHGFRLRDTRVSLSSASAIIKSLSTRGRSGFKLFMILSAIAFRPSVGGPRQRITRIMKWRAHWLMSGASQRPTLIS